MEQKECMECGFTCNDEIKKCPECEAMHWNIKTGYYGEMAYKMKFMQNNNSKR